MSEALSRVSAQDLPASQDHLGHKGILGPPHILRVPYECRCEGNNSDPLTLNMSLLYFYCLTAITG